MQTPGPWTWYDDGDGNDVDPPEPGKRWLSIMSVDTLGGEEVAVIVNRTGEPTERQQANARLIAAAPDLLAAARETLMLCIEHRIDGSTVCHDLRDAIAKAEGR